MRLTCQLLKKIKPGNIYIGKNRVYPVVEEHTVENLRKLLKREDRNMLLLRNAYYTWDQSEQYENELVAKQAAMEEQKIAERKLRNFKPTVTMADLLDKVRTTDRWD